MLPTVIATTFSATRAGYDAEPSRVTHLGPNLLTIAYGVIPFVLAFMVFAYLRSAWEMRAELQPWRCVFGKVAKSMLCLVLFLGSIIAWDAWVGPALGR